MNKAEAIRGNMNASKEETAAFLRDAGIASLQRRAGEMGGETSEKVSEAPLYDWYPIIRPAFWDWFPSTEDMMECRRQLLAGEVLIYANFPTFFKYQLRYSLSQSDYIVRSVWNVNELRFQQYIHIRNLDLVALWLAYNECGKAPF